MSATETAAAPEPAEVRLQDFLMAAPFAAFPAALALDGARILGSRFYTFLGVVHILIYLDLAGIVLATAFSWLRRRPDEPLGLLPVLVLFGSFLPATALATYDDAYSAGKVLRLLTLTPFITAGAVLVFRDRGRRIALVWSFAAIGALVGALTLVDPDPLLLERGTYALRGNNTIGTARIVGFGVVALLCLAVLVERRQARIGALVGAGALAVPLLATGSRGPLLGVIAGGLVFAATRPRQVRRQTLFALGAAGVAVSALVFFFHPAAVPARLGVLLSGQMDTSFSARADLWQTAADTIAARPLGLGWGNFVTVAPLGPFVTLAGTEGSYLYPHNIILEVGSDGGWIALAGLAVFAVAVVRAAWGRLADPYSGAMNAFVVFALVNACVSADINGNLLLLALAGVILAAGRRVRTEVPEVSRSTGTGASPRPSPGRRWAASYSR